MSNEFESIRDVVRDGIARAIAIVGLAGIALIHLLDAPGTFQGSAYKGWLYVALIVGCVGAAAALIRASDPRAWAAAALLAAGAMLAYVVSRTIGLPQGVGEDAVSAKYEHGVLEVHVRKPEQPKPRRIEIGVGSAPKTIEGKTAEQK